MGRPGIVYKIAPRADWEAACRVGVYRGSPDDLRDGFVHLSTESQVAGTLQRHFAGQRDLLRIGFETDSLGAALRFEPSRDGQLFPHLYGALATGLAVEISEIS